MGRPRFQYRLRSLLLVTAVIAAVFGVVGSQVRGRVQVGFERPFFTDLGRSHVDVLVGASPMLVFVCATEDDARRLYAQFDRGEFCSQVESIAGRSAPPSKRLLRAYTVNTVRSGSNLFIIKYDFAEWGRYRLDLRRMAYVSDVNDPDAQRKNEAIHRTFQQAGEALARAHPAIQTYHPFSQPGL
jgi:hypothetical protein